MGIFTTRNRLAVLIIISCLWSGLAHAAALRTLDNGSFQSYCKQYDFVGGSVSNVGQNCVVTDGSGSSAPADATFITQTVNGTLTNEQAMSALASGIVYNTTTTGVQSIATAGTDYVLPGGNVATATALAADPTDCAASNFATGIDASGNLTCAVPAGGGFDPTAVDSATWSDGSNASNAWTYDLSGTDPVMTFNSGAIAITGNLTATNLSGSNTGDQTNITGNAGTVTNGVYTTDFPLNQDTTGNAATATDAEADGTDCAVGSYARGVDVSWNGEGCTDASTEIDSIVATHTAIAAAHHAATVETNTLETTINGILDTEIFVGDGANSGNFVVLSADATLANDGAVTVVDDSHAHTTTTLSGIAVGDLANGTDGELITWSAAAVATTVGAGTVDQVLTSNGAGNAPTFQDISAGGGTEYFSSSGTFNVPAGVSTVYITMVGGGGGGGGGQDDWGASSQRGGGGGGSGGYVINHVFAVTPSGSETVTIGAAGTGGATGSGGNGGATSFGTLSVEGGDGGTSGGSGSGPGGDGGNQKPLGFDASASTTTYSATGGDIKRQGGNGASANFGAGASLAGGGGGASPWGDGVDGKSRGATPPAAPAANTGAGGGGNGGASGTPVGYFTGGPGAAGMVIVVY